MDEYIEKAKKIILENIYMTIATATKDGRPWISPVFFAYDENYNLFWVSNKDSLHSNLIKDNPQIAIVIFNSQAPEDEGDGVYFESIASVLEDDIEIKQAMELLSKRVTKDEFRIKKIGEVTSDGIWRIYRATPTKISKLTKGEFINSQYVDRRIDIKLP